MVSSSQCPKILLLFTSFALKDNGKIKNVLNDRLNYLLSSYFNPMMSASEFLEKVYSTVYDVFIKGFCVLYCKNHKICYTKYRNSEVHYNAQNP